MKIKKAELLDERGRRLIGKFLVGGAAAGGSAALATSLVNYYKTLQQEAAQQESTAVDDDTIYVNLTNPGTGANGAPPKEASIAGGLAMTGGSLATLGTYAAVHKLYQQFKKKRLQDQLDTAQQGFYEVTEENSKMAATGKPMGGVEMATSVPVTLTLLAALASGALTHKALDKSFPKPHKKNPLGPKRFVIRRDTDPSYYESVEEGDEYTPDEPEKMASYDLRNDQDVYTDGLEFLVHMCLGSEKSASVSDLHNLVGAVISGDKQIVIDNSMEFGFETAMQMSKGAHEYVKQASPVEVGLAVSQCVHTPELQPITNVLASCEYMDIAPHFCKAASDLPERNKDILCKIAGTLGAYGRSQTFANADLQIKEAFMGSGMPVDIETLMGMIEEAGGEGIPEGGELTAEDGIDDGQLDENPEDQQTLLSTDSESSEDFLGDGLDEEEEEDPRVVNQHKAVSVEADPKDEIDQMLTG